jgi:hypothetical protein
MKLGLIVAIGGLAAATLGAEPAEAGKKGKNHGNWSGNVHISPSVSTKNLHRLKNSMPHGANRKAIDKEIGRRQQIIDEKHQSKELGKIIGDGGAGAQTILDIGIFGTELGKRRRSGH